MYDIGRMIAHRLLEGTPGSGKEIATLQKCVVGEKVFAWLRQVRHTVGEVLYGMTLYDMVRGLRRQRADVEQLFVLIAFGDMLGLPIIPPYYTLRLLPYVVPLLDIWKRRMLRERDLTDLADLIGDIG